MKLAVLFSGGKDSTYALSWALSQGFDVKYLVTVFPESKESFMFHYPDIKLVKTQARLTGIPQIIVKTKGEKEKELLDLKKALKKLEIQGVVSGAIESEYQKQRIDFLCEELGLISFSPLWHKDKEQLLKEQIDSGFKAIITMIAAAGLDESWLGREINEKCLSNLKKISKEYGVNIAFEGGEAETLTFDCPLFNKKIQIIKAEKEMEGENRGFLIIKKYCLS